MRTVKIGRPSLAAETSQLPATTVPAAVHDAVAREALRRGVSQASVVRDAVVSHLKTHQPDQPVHNRR